MRFSRFVGLSIFGAVAATIYAFNVRGPRAIAESEREMPNITHYSSSQAQAPAEMPQPPRARPPVQVLAPALASAPAPTSAPEVFADVRDGATHRQIEEKSQVPSTRAREAKMDTGAFAISAPSERKKIALNLFPDVNLIANVTMRSDDGDVSIQGSIEGDRFSEVYLRRSGSVLVGTVGANGRSYQIQSSGRGTQYIMEIDESRIQTGQDDSASDKHAHGGLDDPNHDPADGDLQDPLYAGLTEDEPVEIEMKASIAAATVVRIGVVYSKDARDAAGGKADVEAEISNEIAKINSAMKNSGLSTRVELARKYFWDGKQGDSSIQSLLPKLSNSTDKFLDDLHDWRKDHALDLVMLYVSKDKGACGIAYIGSTSATASNKGWSVASRSCNYKHTVTHEVGHNFGADHNPANAGGASVSYARGAYNITAGFRTVMSYNCGKYDVSKCPRMNWFSSPKRFYKKQPTGVKEKLDNARRVSETADAISKYSGNLSSGTKKAPSSADIVID